MITREEFINLCRRTNGKFEEKEDVWVCKTEDETSYVSLLYDLTTNTFHITVLKDGAIKDFGLYDPYKIEGMKICDETNICIKYSDKDKDVTYEVQVITGDRFEIKSAEEIDDDVGIIKFVGNCEYNKENNKFVCEVYKVGSFIDARKISTEGDIIAKLLDRGIREEIVEDIARKIREKGLKEVTVDVIDYLNFIEHTNINITEGLFVVNDLLKSDKVRKYFEELKKGDVDMLLVSYEDMNRKRSLIKIAQTSGNYYDKEKSIVVSVNVSAPIKKDIIKETILHEIGHALQEIKGETLRKLPEHIAEEQVEKFVERVEKKL